MKTTEEKNRMIAKFMGFKDLGNLVGGSPRVEKHVRGITYQSYLYSELKYHSSWEWLMPVIENIESLSFNVEQSLGSCTIHPCVEKEPVFESYEKTRFEATYNAVCEFIEWYNENK